MTLAPGTRLGSYEVTAQIGVGGMGEVYRATDTRLGRQVAIKVLPVSLAQDGDRLARFEREARTLASLNPPNIAAIHGIHDGPPEGGHYDSSGRALALVMELVEGPTLAERIVPGPMPIDDALPIARQIADALAAAHEQGIIHRDLKPANVKVRPDGAVKVLDFGLAKALAGPPEGGHYVDTSLSPTITSPAMTQAGLILGTAAYMSPEQARGKAVDKRADIWAFGCVLYEMLTGTRAFDAEDVSLTLSVVLQKEPDFAAIPAGVPAHVAQTLRLCLKKDPKQRASDINDVRLALEGAFAPPAAVPVAQTAPQPMRRRNLWAIAVAVPALVAAVSIYAWWQASRPVERPLTQLSVDLGPAALLAPRQTVALSPDGTRIVFVGRSEESGTRQLYTRRLDERTATPIAGTTHGPTLSMPFFSPAGDWIGYIAGNGVRKVPVQGGSNFLVAEVSPQPLGAGWGDDDRIVIASAGGLFRVPSGGGTVEKLKTADGARWFVQVLPGARAVLVNSANLTTLTTLDDLRIDVVDLETGETKTVENGGYEPRYLPTRGTSGHLVFVRQGTLFAAPFDPQRLSVRGTPTAILSDLGNASILDGGGQYSFGSNGTFVYLAGQKGASAYPISWLNAAGQTTPLVPQPGLYGAPRISPDGSRLAYTATGTKGADVWVYDFRRDAPTQLTFTGPGLREVAWAPDSKHLVFGDGESLWWIRADGSGAPQKLLEKTANPRPFSFSPDGHLVYSPFGVQGLPDLWTVPIDLSDPERPKAGRPEPFLTDAFVEVDPAFSPDGKFIAYSSNEFGAANDIFVRPFPGKGGKWRVSTGGGKFPAWSPTTRELFFLGGDDRIMVASYTVIGDSFVAAAPRPWSPTQVFRDGVRLSFDVAPDGKRVVIFPRPAETKNEGSLHATFLLNFFDELRRRIP
jgi:serine/threonine-protein kinase